MNTMARDIIVRGEIEMSKVRYLVRTSPKSDKEYHLKRLQKLCEDSLGEIPHLDEPTEEQKEWVLKKLKRGFK
jgi:hypothetical protein